jgi:hypothetical protein
VKINQIVGMTGMSKHNILAQLLALENSGVIETLSSDQNGRLIKFLTSTVSVTSTENGTGYGNGTGAENGTGSVFGNDSSSSFFKDSNTTTTGGTFFKKFAENGTSTENSTGSVFGTDKDDHFGQGTVSGTGSENGTHITITSLPPPSSVKNISNRLAKKFAASDVFFLITAAVKSPEDFSKQAFNFYWELLSQNDKQYVNGLLYGLLLSAKDSPSAYFIKAVKNGAEPNAKNIEIAKEIISVSEMVFLEVGVDILPKDFAMISEKLKIKTTQENLKKSLDSFISMMLG